MRSVQINTRELIRETYYGWMRRNFSFRGKIKAFARTCGLSPSRAAKILCERGLPDAETLVNSMIASRELRLELFKKIEEAALAAPKR